jgi:ubiquinone/menaquinone biosynthesis C-methylase UbiE
MKMRKWMSNLDFRMMALTLRLREGFRDPRDELVLIGLRAGQVVLDYGCGAGSYTIPAAQIVGDEGRVYALDVHPLAVEMVEKRAAKQGLANVKTIYSDRDTGLPNSSVDVVLLYDVLHAVQDKQLLLQELGRVLKSGGILSVRPEHMAKAAFLATVEESGLFVRGKQLDEAYQFVRREPM